jgi:cephalosporin hydroxylase
MWQEKTNSLDLLNPTVDYEDQMDSLESQDIIVVSATRLTESEFWTKSALGLSLKKHQRRDKRIHTAIRFENKRSLSDIYNDQIANAIGEPILAFIHDDVWIDEPDFVDKVIQGLRTFDIIGVAGNKRIVKCQPSWCFINDDFIWDTSKNLTGVISHGRSAFGDISFYGVSPAPSKLLDGVFLASHRKTLLDSNVYFDSSFKFHFYDLDFCRSASQAGLSLGSYPIRLTHQSDGRFRSFEWRDAYYKYLVKWEEIDYYNNKNIVEKEKSEFERSIENVMIFAKQHFKAGNFDEAKNLIDEVLLHSPEYADAKKLMELIDPKKNTKEIMKRSASYKSFMSSPHVSYKHTTYFDSYDHFFDKYRGKEITFVEIGILDGGSLFMWREYFGAQARIIGIDLNPEAKKWEKEGFEIYIGSQSDPNFWERFVSDVGEIDIVLDDGGHTYSQQIITTENLLPHIKNGGLIVIEDTHTSYMSGFGDARFTFIEYVKESIDKINMRFGKFPKDKAERRFWSIEVVESIVAFKINIPATSLFSEPIFNIGSSFAAKDFRLHDTNALIPIEHLFNKNDPKI